jgi:DNA processing protein
MTASDDRDSEQAALVALLRARPANASWSEITASVLEQGSARAVWDEMSPPDLFGPDPADDVLASSAADLAAWKRDMQVITIIDDDYPARLRGIFQAPPILFARGEVVSGDRAVSIVGSRSASPRGQDLAGAIARAMVELNLTVASGLAMGIDAAAHTAALECGGRTVAFLGTGVRKYYPKGNETLQDSIAERGLLLSQFWPDSPPQKHTFLMRNAVMSGYGLATIVVEAGETSGSRAQARMAVEHGRPVILTDIVVHANKWAQALIGRPGVHQVASLEEVVRVVERLSRTTAAPGSLADRTRALMSV